MFKHLISELKEALVCLQPGRVTLDYPFAPHPPVGEFRGLPMVEFETCFGCGACANACPARLIALSDEGEYRVVSFALSRCSYCGRCRDACPARAINMSPAFETSTTDLSELRIEIRLVVVRCRECGEVIGTRRGLERVRECLSREIGVLPEAMSWADHCSTCRRRSSLDTPALIGEIDYEWLNP